LGNCEKENFPTPPNNSLRPKTAIGDCLNDFCQHGRRCPEEHEEKLKCVYLYFIFYFITHSFHISFIFEYFRSLFI
jgi:hypothetical protein